MENEIWLPVLGYEGIYKVSNLGSILKIQNKLQEKIMGIQISDSGYLTLGLSKNKKRQHFFVHRLVAIAFIPNPENKPFVNHIDGNKQNASVKNLEWCTQKENVIHSRDVLKRQWKSKISKEDVFWIYDNHEMGAKAISEKLNISYCHVKKIRSIKVYERYFDEYVAQNPHRSNIYIPPVKERHNWSKKRYELDRYDEELHCLKCGYKRTVDSNTRSFIYLDSQGNKLSVGISPTCKIK